MMVNAENIYKYRGYIRGLYLRDASLEADLPDSIFDIMGDKVSKIDVEIGDFYIGITMDETATQEDYNEVENHVSEAIHSFILQNRNEINVSDEERNEFFEFIEIGKPLYELYTVGNLIKFSL